MKGIVIQGGGSYGAYTVGRLCKTRKQYDVAVGSSTGALIAPFALLGEFDTLKRVYTSINNKDIYSKYPFYKNGVPNISMAIWAWVRQKKGITDSKPLRDLIRKTYTEDLHKRIVNSDKKLFITVCHLNAREKASVYIDADDVPWNTFCEMLWASTLVPGLLEPLQIIETIYKGSKVIDIVDGGTTENIGLKKAIDIRCKEIDVFLHEAKSYGYKDEGKNWVHNLIRAIAIQRQEVVEDDIRYIPSSCKVNINYLNEKLEGAEIMEFNSSVMNVWFNKGFNNDKEI